MARPHSAPIALSKGGKLRRTPGASGDNRPYLRPPRGSLDFPGAELLRDIHHLHLVVVSVES